MYKPIAMPCKHLPAMRSSPTAAPLTRRPRGACRVWPIKGAALLLILGAALLSSTQRSAAHVFDQVIVFGDSNVDSGYASSGSYMATLLNAANSTVGIMSITVGGE